MSKSTLTRFASRAGSAAVAGVAGYASYQHIVHVALMAGESRTVAMVYPLAIDGLIVVGTMAMLADKASGRYPRLSARFALAFGIIATLAANVASAQPTTLARMVAAVPAIAFLAAVEVLSRHGKLRPVDAPTPVVVPVVVAQPAEPVAQPAPLPVPVPVKPAAPVRKPVAVAAPTPSTADLVAKVAAQHPELTSTQVATRLGISPRTARRYMPAVSADQRSTDQQGTDVQQLVPALV
jgi:hypothetical protein